MAEPMLPYRTDWRSLTTLLDQAKGKGVDRATLEARMGAGESLRETLNAAEQLALATRDDAGDVRLTSLGERLAYSSSEEERRDDLARAILDYPPYAIPLDRAVAEALPAIDGPWVERVWQVDMRLRQPRNRVEEARTLYFRLADEAGLGSYRRGVRGQPTRLTLAGDAAGRLAALRASTPASDHHTEAAPAAPAGAQPSSGASSPALAVQPSSPVSLNITVDLSDWDLDKIEQFLQLVGILEPK
ncbi:MAG TPA: hypothetical protein VKU87_04460 [Thermomicrobiaceae bacterium]|nr:hypothetical protein [Thermomicrobiaceae bacterium]